MADEPTTTTPSEAPSLDVPTDAPTDVLAEHPEAPEVVTASILEGHSVEAGNYDASAIQVLEGLEAVRKRPGMYIGSTGERGLHHLVWEVVDNSVDEALAGFCDRVEVTILPDGAIQVSDNGRGIPVDIPPGQELPAVTVVLTVLHAGGKFGGSGYKVSGGLHGVGVSVVNALSKRVEVEIKRDGYQWFQAFEMGVPTGPLEKGEPTEETGTTTRFWANDDIFETVDYSFETITNRFREMAFLNKGLEIVVRDERPAAAQIADAIDDDTVSDDVEDGGEGSQAARRAADGVMERRFKFDRGLVDYVEHLNRSKTIANPTIINFEAETPESHESHMSLELAMQWNTTVQRVGAHLRQHHQHP